MVPFIDQVTDRLSNQMVGNRVADHVIFLEKFPTTFDVTFLIECPPNVKVIAPTGEFNSVIAHILYLGQKIGEREIGPLAGEECYWSCHCSG